MTWTEEQMEQALVHTDMLAEAVRKSLCRAIKVANQSAGVSKDDFWKNLFIDKQLDDRPGPKKDSLTSAPPLMMPTRDKNNSHSIPNCPQDPYDHLDLQLCLKYLFFGPNRAIKKGDRYVRLEESLHFYKYFGITAGRKAAYWQHLNDMINYRNKDKSHRSNAYDRSITPERLLNSITYMEAVLQPLLRKPGWEGNKTPLRTYWTQRLENMYKAVGALPIRLRTLTDNLCAGELFPNQIVAKQVNALLKLAQIPVKDGYVYLYNTTPTRLEQGLLQFISAGKETPDGQDAQLLQYSLGLAEAPPAPQTQEKPAPLPAALAQLLRRYPRQLPASEEVLDAVLKGFTLLVDTRVFLSQEGAALLRSLVSVLRKTGQKLPVDAGVVQALMRSYRENSPQALSMEADILSREDRLALEELYTQSRAALKTLRFLREQNCLQIITAASTEPMEGFLELIRQHPKNRFFVFADDATQAKAIAEASRGNAVAVKVCLDGNLLIYSSTKDSYQALLETEEPAPAENTAQRLYRVRAVAADGSHMQILLEKKLGQGGEGTVYLTDGGQVAKIYHGPQQTPLRREKLEYMIRNDPHIEGVCWPQALIYTLQGQWLGYLMPQVPGTTLDDAVFHPGMDFIQIRRRGWQRQHLALICGNIATVFARMHSRQILMGDVNPQNIMVDDHCNVYFVDCDSYQFADFECPVGKPDYTPPEIHRAMRAQGITQYRYRRTEEHERYSMAVLLFSVLMMGKPPYAARNAGFDDVVDAVIAGHFPYPYKTEGEEPAQRSAVMAPAGVWRNIWSHMTYQLKTCFYNTFAQQGTGRLSAQQWAQAMQEYVQTIRIGHSTDEIAPHGYKDTSHDPNTATKMVERLCSFCQQPYNIAEDVYLRRKDTPEAELCGVHYEMMRNFRTRTRNCTCDRCGNSTPISVYHWMQQRESGKSILCDACENVSVICARCGKPHKRNREKVDALRREGRQLLCKDCLTRQKGS